jgi:hypothetical protein
VRVNLIDSLYTSVFIKKNKKINTLKKKIHVNSAIRTVHMPPLFTEQCSMVELRAAQESSIFLLSNCLRFARNLLWNPYTVNNFFSLTKHLLSAFLKKRNLYLVAKRARNRLVVCATLLAFLKK